MDSGTVQKLIELHLQKVGMSPRSKRAQVFKREAEYLAKLISENGAISTKALRSRLLDTAEAAGISREEAITITENVHKWAKMEEEFSLAAPTTNKGN